MPFTNKQNTNLREFRQIVGDAARSYLFEIDIPVITNDINDAKTITCLARSANLPRYTIEDVPFEFQKSTFHMGGRAKFDSWQVTFMADVYHKLRNRLLTWQSVIFDPTRQVGYSPSSYKRDGVTIKQLDRTGSVVTSYEFKGLFPSEVGEIQVDQGTTSFEEFNVIFTYDYYVIGSQIDREVKYPDQQSAVNLKVGSEILSRIYAEPSVPASENDISQQEIDLSYNSATLPASLGFFDAIGASPTQSSQPYGDGSLNTPDSSNRETTIGNISSFNPYNALGVPYSYRWMPPVKGLASVRISRRGIG